MVAAASCPVRPEASVAEYGAEWSEQKRAPHRESSPKKTRYTTGSLVAALMWHHVQPPAYPRPFGACCRACHSDEHSRSLGPAVAACQCRLSALAAGRRPDPAAGWNGERRGTVCLVWLLHRQAPARRWNFCCPIRRDDWPFWPRLICGQGHEPFLPGPAPQPSCALCRL